MMVGLEPCVGHAAPPQPSICCVRAANVIFAVYFFVANFRSMTKQARQKTLRIEQIFSGPFEKEFLGRQRRADVLGPAAADQKLTGAPPLTQ